MALRDRQDLPITTQPLTFTVQASRPIPPGAEVEVEIAGGDRHLTVALDGTDPDAVLRNDRTFDLALPVAFASVVQNGDHLQLRLLLPAAAPLVHVEHEPPMQLQVDAAGHETITQTAPPPLPHTASEWIALGRFVRVPIVRRVACPANKASPCILEGEKLDAIAAVSAEEQPAVFTGVQALVTARRIAVPRPVHAMLLLKLRGTPEATALLHATEQPASKR